MEQNDRLEKNKDFFQGKQLFNTKLLPIKQPALDIAEDVFFKM